MTWGKTLMVLWGVGVIGLGIALLLLGIIMLVQSM